MNCMWRAEAINHKGVMRIAVYFEHDEALNVRIRKLADARWSVTLKAWHVPDNAENRARFKLAEQLLTVVEPAAGPLATRVEIERVELPDRMQHLALAAYVEMMRLRNYSDQTIETYKRHFIAFLVYHNHIKPSEISKGQIMDYLVMLRRKENWSSSHQNQVVNAIKYFYEKVLKQARTVYDLPRAK